MLADVIFVWVLQEVVARYVSMIPSVSDSVVFPGLCDIWSTCDVSLPICGGLWITYHKSCFFLHAPYMLKILFVLPLKQCKLKIILLYLWTSGSFISIFRHLVLIMYYHNPVIFVWSFYSKTENISVLIEIQCKQPWTCFVWECKKNVNIDYKIYQ